MRQRKNCSFWILVLVCVRLNLTSSLSAFSTTRPNPRAARYTRDESETAVALVQFLASHGCKRLDDGFLELGTLASGGRSLPGVFCRRDVGLDHGARDDDGDDVLVSIPSNMTLDLTPTPNQKIPKEHDSDAASSTEMKDVLQGLKFLQTNEHSLFWKPYLESLPRADDDSFDETPDFWSKNVLDELEPVSPWLVERAMRRKECIEKVAHHAEIDARQLQWATWLVRSRRFTITHKHQQQSVLIPFVDMINHDSRPNAVIDMVSRGGRPAGPGESSDDSTTLYVLRAVRPIGRGEQVTILYGNQTSPPTSFDLLDQYGFWLEDDQSFQQLYDVPATSKWPTSLHEDLLALEDLQSETGQHSASERHLQKALGFRIHLRRLRERLGKGTLEVWR